LIFNYDPAHNLEWLNAQKNDNVTEMQKLFTRDLAQIKAMNFGIIKTFYSTYCTDKGRCIAPVAQLAQQAGLKVMLGVREFPNNPDWTVTQVQAAINQAKRSGTPVIGIVVGNEDMFDNQGNPRDGMQERIVADIKTIRAAEVSVTVTTAQRQNDWCGGSQSGCAPNRTNSLNQRDPYGVLNTVQVIGANIYPYWGGSPEKINGQSVARLTQSTAKNLLTALGPKGVKDVIITEEGWPSRQKPGQNPNGTSIDDERDYFSTWSKHENQTFDSYYFAAYDKRNDLGFGDADYHFGLCLEDGGTKDPRLIRCPPRP
jgi:exo-beta-1,3-glucanase (GH17 family)